MSAARARWVAAAIALVAGASALPAPARAASPEETFQQACHAYEQGKWDEAAETYRGLLRYGFADPRLEYDLANAEFKLGHLGQAILHYERARRLDPADGEIAANLALARSKIRDVVEDPDARGPIAALRRLQDAVGPSRQAILVLVGVWLIAGIVTWCGSRTGGFTPGWSWSLAGVVLATAIVAASWQATATRLYGTPRAVVLKPAAEALAGPGLQNTALFTLHEGTTVEILSSREGWLQVALPNGLSGWVAQDDAERV